MAEIARVGLSDVDEALQHEKNGGVDVGVETEVIRAAKVAAEHNLHVKVLPAKNGEVVTMISS